jgi:excinuclease ABC subunit A
MFSFNSPYGACPECAGLGTKTEFDPELVIPDPSVSLDQGAVAPFVHKNGELKDWWPDVFEGLAQKHGFKTKTAFEKLPKKIQNMVFEGTDETVAVTVRYGSRGRVYNTSYEGVLKILKKRYDTTESEWV